MIRTFLDANVLISAGKGNWRDVEAALRILHREKQCVSVKLKEQYFANAENFDDLKAMLQGANEEMMRTPLGLADALQITAEALLGADEFITGEGCHYANYLA